MQFALLKSTPKHLGVLLLGVLLLLVSCQESKLISPEPAQKIEPSFFLRVKDHPSSISPIQIMHLDSLIFLTSQSVHFAVELPNYENIKSKWFLNDQLYSTTPNLTFTTSPKFVDTPTQITQVITDPLQDSIKTEFLVKILLNPNDSLNQLDTTQQEEL